MGLKSIFAVATVSVAATAFLQCSASPPQERTFGPSGPSGTGGSNAPSNNAGGSNDNGGSGLVPPAGSGGDFVPVATGIPDAGRAPKCDAGVCSCVNIGSLGKPAHYGVNGMGTDSTDAFQNWLNTNSSATVKLITQRVTLTPEFLADFDIIVLQALEDKELGPFWQFTPDEVKAFTEWVQAGGGVIAMSGYGSDSGEVTGVNQLLAFTGISYNRDDVLNKCPIPPPKNCFCWGNSVAMTGWAPGSPLSANLRAVGAFSGRSINAPKDADVVATDGFTNWAVSKQVGKGKVFVFGDEWVTYTSQWLSTSIMKVTNVYDQCYMQSADIVFQVPQFWYNVIKWANPTQCVFTLNDPAIVQ